MTGRGSMPRKDNPKKIGEQNLFSEYRRTVLKASAAGILGGVALPSVTENVEAISRSSIQGTSLWGEDFEDVPLGDGPADWTIDDDEPPFAIYRIEEGGAAGSQRAFHLKTDPFGGSGSHWGSQTFPPRIDAPVAQVEWYWKKPHKYDSDNYHALRAYGPSLNFTNENDKGFISMKLGDRDGYLSGEEYPLGLNITDGDGNVFFHDVYEADVFSKFVVKPDFEAETFELHVDDSSLGTFGFRRSASELSRLRLKIGGWGVSGNCYVDQIRVTPASTTNGTTDGLSGNVRSPFGTPIDGAKITLYDRSKQVTAEENPLATTTTDSNGNYQLNNNNEIREVVLTATHPDQGIFDGYPLNLSDPLGEFDLVVHNQQFFGPTYTKSNTAAVSAWRHIHESNPKFQSLRIEIVTPNVNKFIVGSGFSIIVPESIDVKYRGDMLDDHPSEAGAGIYSHIEYPHSPIHRFFPMYTGIPAFSSVGIIENAYQHRPSDEEQNGNDLKDKVQDILGALPVFGSILGTWEVTQKYLMEENISLVAGSLPENPHDPNTADSVTGSEQRNTDAVVFDVPVRVVDATDELRFTAGWLQTATDEDKQLFSHQEEVKFLEM